MKGYANLIIRSDLIFTGRTENEIIDGFIGIDGNRICCVQTGSDFEKYKGEDTRVLDMTGKVVSPGFVDNHVFFMGYIWEHVGLDTAHINSEEELVHALKKYGLSLKPEEPLLAHGLSGEIQVDKNIFDKEFPDRAVVVFRESREECCMNQKARDRFGFDEENCYAEGCFRMFKELVGNKEYAREEYMDFQKMLAKQGVTSIKEIGFDDYYGFTDVLKELEESGSLLHRVNLVSQPVGRSADFEYGQAMRETFGGDVVKFMGYNIMVDGDIESYGGDILDKYPDEERAESEFEAPDYEELEQIVSEADKMNFRCALHAEGDRAVRKVIDILEKCRKENGTQDARHAIIDMELIDREDVRRLKENGITAINYVQIMNCYPRYEDYYGLKYFSELRQKTIWPYRSLIDSGAVLCWGTDLPLDVPDIPVSVYFACERKFPDNAPKAGYNTKEAITPGEVLLGWTCNGQKANFDEGRLGTLEKGKLADIAVLDRDIFREHGQRLRETKVCMTICDGKIVYEE